MSDWTLSQSAIDTYQRCARRYYLRYVRGLDWPAPLTSSELDFEQAMRRGEQFHLLIQQHALGMDVTPMVEAGDDDILRTWWQSYLTQARSFVPGSMKAQFTEIELAASIEDVTVMAKFDHVVFEQDGGMLIFDWKTGVPRSQDHLARGWQSVVSQFIAAERGGQLRPSASDLQIAPGLIRLVYWHARDAGQPVRLRYDDQLHEAGRARLVSVIVEIKDLFAQGEESAFARTPDESQCRHCPYRSYCERGKEAGPEMEPDLQPETEELMRNLSGPDDLDL